jgi:hypothetical protein
MRLHWWQYVVGFLVAALSSAAIVGCLAGLVFLVNAVATSFISIAIRAATVRVLLWAVLALFAALGVLALIGMGIDIAESWLWPAPKGTREHL